MRLSNLLEIQLLYKIDYNSFTFVLNDLVVLNIHKCNCLIIFHEKI